MDILREVGVADVLRARDARAERQSALRAAHRAPLISFTMNIAGPVKRNARIERAFLEGVRRVEDALSAHRAQVRARVRTMAFTGCEQLWSVDAPAPDLKAWMRALEDADGLGRLFDIDVLDERGARLGRDTERACLICGGPVRACARSRAHSVQQLFARAEEIIDAHFEGARAVRIGMLAERALLFEAVTTPKPGLVDRENSGAHRDMDLFDFVSSACALRSWFEACARTGMRLRGAEPETAFEALRADGMRAEGDMRAASGGANTHKGALFSLGLICCAAGMLDAGADADALCARAGALAAASLRELDARAARAETGGELQYARSGRTGARGEAAAGFPHVRGIALPALRGALEAGASLNEAGLRALTALMARVEDSNLLRRGGEAGLRSVQRRAAALEDAFSQDALRRLDAELIDGNLSPGGSADLLAAAYFLHFLEMETEACTEEIPCPQT